MSEQTIREKSEQIRNETQKYANTRERVAGVLDDINDTKANKDASGLSEKNKKAWRDALETEAQIQEVIDGVIIGGRNLMLNSKHFAMSGNDRNNSENNNAGRIAVGGSNGNWNGYTWVNLSEIHKIGDNITFSMDIKSSIDCDINFNYMPFYENHNFNKTEHFSAGQWKRVFVTGVIQNDNGDRHLLGLSGVNMANAVVEFRNAKIERGNKPTDWTPAPEDKMDKPTATLSEPNTEYKYVVILDEQGNTKRMLAGDLGKNIGNSDLETTSTRTFTQAHIYTHSTAGYHYYITGLANKSADPTFNLLLAQNSNGQTAVSNGKAVLENLMVGLPSIKDERTGNYDLGFSEHLVFNPTTRKFAKSDRPQIVSNFNVPPNININHNSQVHNVNYVAPATLPEDVRETLNFIKRVQTLGYTRVLSSEFIYRKLDNYKFPSSASSFNIPNIEFRDGEMFYNGNPLGVPDGFRDLEYQASREGENALFNVMINKMLPSDKNWVFRFRNFQSDFLGAKSYSFFGFRRGLGIAAWDRLNDITSVNSGITHSITNGLGLGFHRYGVLYTNSDFYIVKVGNAISILLLDNNNGEIFLTTTEYKGEDMRYLVFGANLNFSVFNKFYMKDISYWIDN